MGVKENAARTHVAEVIRDPKAAQILSLIHQRLVTGFYQEEWQDIIFQNFREPVDIVCAHDFAQVWAMLQGGEIVTCQIQAEPPHRDAFIAENNELLTHLPFPFEAEFIGGLGDDDGTLEWKAPIEMSAVGRALGASFTRIVKPRGIPLEVGYTSATTTLFHLNQSGAVARWPYGHKFITALVMTDEARDRYMERFWGLFHDNDAPAPRATQQAFDLTGDD